MCISAHLAAKANGNDLGGSCVGAKARAVRHPDELVSDDCLNELERFRHDPLEGLSIGAIGDDHVFAVAEAVGPTGYDGLVSGIAKAAFRTSSSIIVELSC